MIKNTIGMNSDSFSIWMRSNESALPYSWFYGFNYWDLVINCLNQEYRTIAKAMHSTLDEAELEFLQMFEKVPRLEWMAALIKEDLTSLDYDIMKEFVERVFIDDTYPKLSASQKYCVLMEALKYDDSIFSDSHGLRNYTVTASPHYGISDDLSDLAYNLARDFGTDLDGKTIAKGIYDLLCEALTESEGKNNTFKVFTSFDFPSLHDTVAFLLHEMVKNNCTVKKCPNCSRYFVPANRSDTIYCGQPSPQMPVKTCQEYKKYANFLEKTQFDEATRLYKQVYNAKNNRVRRCKTKENPVGNAVLNAELEQFITEAAQWKFDVKTGTKREDEYITWLRGVKEKRVL